jgi:predicted DNA-binding protein (MmcQ/YjbR family)
VVEILGLSIRHGDFMPAPDDPLTSAETFLRGLAMQYPEVSEGFPEGHRELKVKSKLFLILANTDGVLSVTVKLPDSNAYALMQPYAKPADRGPGESDWVLCQFKPEDELPLDLLEEWVEESYRALASQQLVLKLNAREAGDPEPPPPRKRRKS